MPDAKPKPRVWAIKGIPEETREVARMAAERRGIPVNRWLSEAIIRTAEAEQQEHLPVKQDDPVGELRVRLDDTAGELRVRLDELADEVRVIRERTEGTPLVNLRRVFRRMMVRLTPADVGPDGRP
jgi:hypothetical protein